MAFNQIINVFFKKRLSFLSALKVNQLKIFNFNPIIFLSFIVFFSILFFIISNLIHKKNERNKNNLIEIKNSNEFSNITNYISKSIEQI